MTSVNGGCTLLPPPPPGSAPTVDAGDVPRFSDLTAAAAHTAELIEAGADRDTRGAALRYESSLTSEYTLTPDGDAELDAAAEIDLIGNARARGEAFRGIGRMPAQHLSDADATLDLGQAAKPGARARSGEVSEADVAHGDA